MSFEAILPQHIDSTMISCFRSCPRKFYHEFVLGLRGEKVSIHLHAGACFAAALEEFYTSVFTKQKLTIDARKDALARFISEWGDYPQEPMPGVSGELKSFDRMWQAVDDYIATFPPHTDHIQPYQNENGHVTSEFSFAIPLDPTIFPGFPLHPGTNEPFVYCGRFDMLGSYLGKPCVRDEKTGTYVTSNWSEKWDLRSQFLGYCWAGQQYGIDLNTVVVRGVFIQKREIKFQEAVKVYSQTLIDRWFTQLSHDVSRLVQCWNNGYFDYNFADSCTAFNQTCHFTSVCRSNQPEVWMNEYVVNRWNPLMRNPTDTKDVLV